MQGVEDNEGLCAFFRHSRYDLLQVRVDGVWGPVWTFAPQDVHAAEKAAWQVRRMNGPDTKVRHARKIRVLDGSVAGTELVLVTHLPDGEQIALCCETGELHTLPRRVHDDISEAIKTALRGQHDFLVSR